MKLSELKDSLSTRTYLALCRHFCYLRRLERGTGSWFEPEKVILRPEELSADYLSTIRGIGAKAIEELWGRKYDGNSLQKPRALWKELLIPKLPECPECDKMISVHGKSQPIGEFLEWLNTEGLTLCALHNDSWIPERESTEHLLARYFDIDLNRVEKERRELLEAIRRSNINL